jgi:DNA-binding NarL/FixJ family response regulator
MYSLVLADDHPLLLRGLEGLLNAAPDFKVLAATASGAQALSLICDLRPDLAVLDVSMPNVGGLDIQRVIFMERRPVKVIFLAATLTGRQIAEAISMGAWGILLKEYAPEALLDCMRQVAGGAKWLPPELVARATSAGPSDSPQKLNLLTTREREVAVLVCGGLSNRAIAQKLGTTEGTISIHLHNIYRKLEITNRTMLAALHVQYTATQNG